MKIKLSNVRSDDAEKSILIEDVKIGEMVLMIDKLLSMKFTICQN